MRLRRARNAFPHARGALVHQLGVAPLAGQLRIESIRLTSWRNTIAFSRSRTRECEWRTRSISHSGLKPGAYARNAKERRKGGRTRRTGPHTLRISQNYPV